MELIESWKEGVGHFNERRYWEAHEAWERGWKTLPPERKLYVQALIQAAAVFHLLGLGRADPARALAKRALEKFAEARPPFPRIEIPGLESVLSSIASAPVGTSVLSASALRAELLLSPRS